MLPHHPRNDRRLRTAVSKPRATGPSPGFHKYCLTSQHSLLAPRFHAYALYFPFSLLAGSGTIYDWSWTGYDLLFGSGRFCLHDYVKFLYLQPLLVTSETTDVFVHFSARSWKDGRMGPPTSAPRRAVALQHDPQRLRRP